MIEIIGDCELVRWRPSAKLPDVDAIAGWGRKSTAHLAWAHAARLGKPYVSLEDGFLRSVLPGADQPPLSLVIDWIGVHYDATAPSALEARIAQSAATDSPARTARARDALALLRGLAISKYNAGALAWPSALPAARTGRRPRVLVVDQTRNDASVLYGLANGATFAHMLRAAQDENPGADIFIKSHPEVAAGRKAGYHTAEAGARVHRISEAVNPWALLDAVDRVNVVTSQLGLEALMAGRPVSCFGAPFYAGWGITDDRVTLPRRAARPTLEQLIAALYFDYAGYACPYDGHRIAFEEAVERLAFFRDRFLENRQRSVCVNISRWKRAAVDPLLEGAAGPPIHVSSVSKALRTAKESGGRIVSWASRTTPQLERACAVAGVPLVRIEDGFLRSVGLGAAYTPGLSACLDAKGMYYDARSPSDLEHLLETVEMTEPLLARARRLRADIVAQGLTKYNVDSMRRERHFPVGATGILVPGQVLDDASVQSTLSSTVPLDGTENFNLSLLRAVRDRNPDAYIIYKPHPDVAAGLRKGRVSERALLRYADRVISHASVVPLIEQCDRVETLTSLVGFEALLRGKAVTTHGLPFYSGWGLTTDLVAVARRSRTRTVDELVAAALILYPRYVHPATLRPCEPELIVKLLAGLKDAGSARRKYAIGFAPTRGLAYACSLRLRKLLTARRPD